MASNANKPTCDRSERLKWLKLTIVSTADKYAVEAAKQNPDNSRKTALLQKIFNLTQEYKEIRNGQ